MPKRTQITIPEPYETVPSLRQTALATKEAAETLMGQRGDRLDAAITWREYEELPSSSLPLKNDPAWLPFAYINGWVDYAAPYGPAGYRKLSTGLVLLRGLVMNGSAAGILKLPVGYRPGIQMLYIAETSPNSACRLDISPAGDLGHTGGNNGWISLNNICFLAEG